MLLQEQLQDITRFGSPIQSFTVPVDYQDLIFLATSTDTGFLAARITPLYATPSGNIPGDSIEIALNEYAYLNCSESPLILRIDVSFWLSNINLKIWKGLPDDPRPDPHNHTNKSIIDNFTESENKLYYKNRQIPDHAHNNLATIEKISESEGKLFFDNSPVANHHHNDLVLLNLLEDVDGKLYYNYSPVYPVPASLHEHDNLGILSQISVVDGKLLFNEQPIEADMAPIITEINNQTTLLTTKLNELQTSIDNLSSSSEPHDITFTLLSLAPTYQPNSSHGWTTSPTGLSAITDGDSNTSTNLFEAGGGLDYFGEIVMFPGVPIPNNTRINIRLAISANGVNVKPIFEVSVANSPTGFTNIWAYADLVSVGTEIIINIDRTLNFSWDTLRFKITDIGRWSPRMRIYDLRVFAVS